MILNISGRCSDSDVSNITFSESEINCDQDLEKSKVAESKARIEALENAKMILLERLSASTRSDNSDLSELSELTEELKTFEQLGQTLDFVDIEDLTDTNRLLSSLTFDTVASRVQESCPKLTRLVNVIAVGNRSHDNLRRDSSYKFKNAVQMLFSLVNIRSQKSKNSFSKLFGIMLIAHGAGKALLKLLESFELCKGYKYYQDLLKKRVKNYAKVIKSAVPSNHPIMLLFDNANIFKGRARHIRLVSKIVPLMWTFTARAIRIPNLEGIEDMWPEGVDLKILNDVSNLQFKHLQLENYPAQHNLLNQALDIRQDLLRTFRPCH